MLAIASQLELNEDQSSDSNHKKHNESPSARNINSMIMKGGKGSNKEMTRERGESGLGGSA